MVTHDPNAASFCSRILFIQDGVIFHELRRKVPTETRGRILCAHITGNGANGRRERKCSLTLHGEIPNVAAMKI